MAKQNKYWAAKYEDGTLAHWSLAILREDAKERFLDGINAFYEREAMLKKVKFVRVIVIEQGGQQ